MRNDSRIFVAGHRGMVGRAIVRSLREKGFENLVTRARSELDLTAQADVDAFFTDAKPEFVFLAAAKVGGIWANNSYPADFIYTNIMIQSNVIRAAWKHGVNRLLFLGSSCIYPRLCPQPMKEEHLLTGPLEPTNSPYAVAKISGIEMCRSFNRQYGTRFMAVMPTNLYGSFDNFDLETSHALPALVRKFHLAKLFTQGKTEEIEKDRFCYGPFEDEDFKGNVTLWGTGEPKREFLYVDDLADACVFLMENEEETDLLNIGTGKDIRILELAGIVGEIVGYEGKIIFDETKPDGTPQKLLDVSKMEQLGWTAKTELKQGIRKTYEWYLNHLEQSDCE